MARLLAISYGSLTIGLSGDASITLADKFSWSQSYTEGTVAFECVVRSATRSTFLTAEAALVAAYSKPDQALVIQLAGSSRFVFSHSSNTGFNARASALKHGSAEDTANSARYRVTVTVQLPADLSGRSGRQTSMVSVDATPSGKRTVTISGTYTALSSNSAAAQYVSAGTTYCDSVLTAIGGTYELLTPINASGSGFAAAAGFKYDDQNKVLSFQRVYLEEIFSEGVGALTVAAIKRQSFVISRTTPPAPGDATVTNTPFTIMRAVYSCWVDKDTTTDLATLYAGTIRPHLLAQIDAHTGGVGGAVVVSETPEFDKAENRIAATIECAAGGGLLTSRLTVEDDVIAGLAFAPVWSADPYEVDEYDVPALHIRTIRRLTVALAGSSAAAPNPDPPAGFRRIRVSGGSYSDSMGTSGARIPVTVMNETSVYRRVKTNAAAAGGGGAVGGPGAAGGGGGLPNSPLGIFGIGAGMALDFGGKGATGIFGIGSGLTLEFGP